MQPITVKDALAEVIGGVTPYPRDIERIVSDIYLRLLNRPVLRTEKDLMGFVCYLAAVAYSTGGISQVMIVDLDLEIFCKRRSLVVEGFGLH